MEFSIFKPKKDDREYNYFILPNGIKVVTIYQADTDVSAASMCVETGCFDDPDDIPGLSHFLEHMLFMGTSKYPDEKAFLEFVKNNGGSRNGYTDDTLCNYFYEIESSQFEQSLDRFSRFFSSPLLKLDCVKREMKSVNSEFEKNRTSDNSRFWQILKNLSRRDHPFSRFSTGNQASLDRPDIHERVREFFSQRYSANLMYLVIYGSEKSENLRKMAEKYFSEVKNLDIPKGIYPGTIFNPESMLFKIHHVIPLREQRELELYFPLTERFEDYKITQKNLIGHIIGHESEGTLFFHLKKKGWLTSLSAGTEVDWQGMNLWSCSMELSAEGEKHVEEIILEFFKFVAFVKTMKREDLVKTFEEQRQICNEVLFHFEDNERPSKTCPSIACVMQKNVNPEDFLRERGEWYYAFHEQRFRDEVSQIRMDQMICFWISSTHEQQQQSFIIEKLYGGKYRSVDFSPEFVKKCQEMMILSSDKRKMEPIIFHPPILNEYIPKNLNIFGFENEEEKAMNQYPRKIYDSKKMRIFFKQDTQFELPKSDFSIRLYTPSAMKSARNYFLQKLFTLMVSDFSNSVTYHAEMMELSFTVAGCWYGLAVDMDGWNDSLPKLLGFIIDVITHFEGHFDETRFLVVKEELLRRQKNRKMDTVTYLGQFLGYYSLCAVGGVYHYDELLEVGEKVTLEDVKEYYRDEFMGGQLRIQVLAMGNEKEEEVKSVLRNLLEENEKFAKMKVYPEEEFATPRIIRLDNHDNKPCVMALTSMNPTDTNSCLIYNLLIGPRNERNDIIMGFLELMMDSDVFDALRNKQQLGYLVGIRYPVYRNVRFAQFFVQSSEFDPIQLVERVEKFIEEYFKKLEAKITEEYFCTQMEVLRKKFVEKPKNLGEESEGHWEEIVCKTYRFSRFEEYAKLVEKGTNNALRIKKEDIIEFFKKYFVTERVVYQLMIFSEDKLEKMKLIDREKCRFSDNINFFKENCKEFYPSFFNF